MRVFLPFLILAAACAPASAQQGAGGVRMIEQLEKADANGDGAVSKAEFTAHRQAQFPRLDRNKDGFFTDGDVPKIMKNRMPAGFTPGEMRGQFDVNGDGRISEHEFVHGPAMAFDRIDANADGVVTSAELQTARTQLAQRQG